MKLSERTVKVLKNFSTINPSLVVEKGSRLRTISYPGTVYAVAEVEEEFPIEFGVYQLPKLLKVLDLFKDPEIDFHEKKMTIHEESTKVNFSYCSSDLIVHPPKKDIKTPTDTVDFELRADVFARVQKAMSIFEFEHVSFTSKDGKLWITTQSGNRSSSDDFMVEIGDVSEKVNQHFAVDNLRMIPGNYMVRLGDQISVWESLDDEGLKYWIAPKAE